MTLNYELFLLKTFIFIITISHAAFCSENRNENSKPVAADTNKLFNNKPCFILGSAKLPPGSVPNPEVTCIPDGQKMLPPIPELTFQGISYSSIHYREDIFTTPIMSAFNIFAIDLQKNISEQMVFQINSQVLYASMLLAARSLGNALPYSRHSKTNLKSVLKILDFQRARLEKQELKVKKALAELLRSCVNCSVRERYSMIMLAGESGIEVEDFLENLDKVGCITKNQCEEEKMKAQKKITLVKTSSGTNKREIAFQLIIISLIICYIQLQLGPYSYQESLMSIKCE